MVPIVKPIQHKYQSDLAHNHEKSRFGAQDNEETHKPEVYIVFRTACDLDNGRGIVAYTPGHSFFNALLCRTPLAPNIRKASGVLSRHLHQRETWGATKRAV